MTNASKQPVRQAHWRAQNWAHRIWRLAQLSGMKIKGSRGHLRSLRTFSTFFFIFDLILLCEFAVRPDKGDKERGNRQSAAIPRRSPLNTVSLFYGESCLLW
jgi:hypothetical protein